MFLLNDWGYQRWLWFCKDIHLAFVALELQPEAAAISKTQEERLVPSRYYVAPLSTMSEGIAQTMSALHDERRARGCDLEGWRGIRESVGNVEICSLTVRYIISIGEPSVFRLPLFRLVCL